MTTETFVIISQISDALFSFFFFFFLIFGVFFFSLFQLVHYIVVHSSSLILSSLLSVLFLSTSLESFISVIVIF